jgi:hypothetical protein
MAASSTQSTAPRTLSIADTYSLDGYEGGLVRNIHGTTYGSEREQSSSSALDLYKETTGLRVVRCQAKGCKAKESDVVDGVPVQISGARIAYCDNANWGRLLFIVPLCALHNGLTEPFMLKKLTTMKLVNTSAKASK